MARLDHGSIRSPKRSPPNPKQFSRAMWFVETLRHTPALAVFLTIGLGFLLGRLKFKGFSLGTVTSVLIVGVLVGQMDIDVGGPLQMVSFMLFLFCIGYSVGPEFFSAMRGDGLKQVLFAVVVCAMILLTSWGVALWMGLDPGQAAGMMAGASTASPVVGAASDAVSGLNAPTDHITEMINAIPVCYAMTYVFGTIGAVWLLGYVGPTMMGGIDRVRQLTREYELAHTSSVAGDDPSQFDADRPVTYRAYKADGSWMDRPRKVAEIEAEFVARCKRITVERIRHGADGAISDATDSDIVAPGDRIVISGRREMVVGDHGWLGVEVADIDLLSFPVESVDVTVSRVSAGTTLRALVDRPWMDGVDILTVSRDGKSEAPRPEMTTAAGDIVKIIGRKKRVDDAAVRLGYPERRTNATDFVFVGFGVFLGGLLGVLAVHFGDVSVSLGTSGGALVAGLLLGWLRSKRPVYGSIPKASLWVFNNLGLNMYIAVVGITSGPSFVSSFEAVGPKIFLAGMIVTLVPMFLALVLSYKVFKFHPAIALGCCAGARKTTAGLGAVQERLGSTVPALGYTITYAISNTLLIILGILLVLLLA
ncbi:MAG: aspartate-alanine antiporter [Clostridium sp.]|nr:aspartate-alanine antiporter [Clostridium sp.]